MTQFERLRLVKDLLQQIADLRSEYYPVGRHLEKFLNDVETLIKGEYNAQGVCGWDGS